MKSYEIRKAKKMFDNIKDFISEIDKKEKVNILIKKVNCNETIFSYNENNVFVSASLIKIPIMLATLNEVKNGNISFDKIITVSQDDILDDNEVFEKGKYKYSVKELIYFMITVSDNTSTNILIKLLGFDYINKFIKEIGLRDTKLERYMNDWKAIKNGKNNYTTLVDMNKCFEILINEDILNNELCNFAINTLYGQKINNQIPRYIPNVKFAHKTGGLDYLNSDVGIFEKNGEMYFIGISIYDTPEKTGDRKSVSMLAKIMYDFI